MNLNNKFILKSGFMFIDCKFMSGRGLPKKYTSLKSNCSVVGEDRLVKLALFIRQGFNLNFDASLSKLDKN